MKKIFKKYEEKYKSIFEACGDSSIRSTFEGELNYEAGKLFFTMFIAAAAWVPYVKSDLVLHQFPTLAAGIRIGFTLLSATLILLKLTKRFRNSPNILLLIMTCYLNAGTAIVTSTAGYNAPSYIGGFCFVLMLSIFGPFQLKYKIVISLISFFLFFACGALTGMDFSNAAVRYSIGDLTLAFILNILLSFLLNRIKHVSWQRLQQSTMLIDETIDIASRAEAASRSKSDFLAKMSHEIRTPMNAITGMAELAMREDSLDSAKKHVFTIKQAGANLLSIINDILDFSKIESGKMELLPADYTFSSLVNDAVSITRMRVLDSRLDFVVNIDSNIPNALYGDETRIRQILLNVLSNAAKYTKKGFVSLSVNGEITGEDTVLLTIDVTDSGKGIKQEDIDKLFGEFSQVDTAENKGIEGTGLGLAITRSLIRAMGGDIKVRSEYGKGSTFTIELPQKIRSYKPLAEVENPKEKNVLIYEQNEIYADSIVCAVDNLGVECERAKDVEELREKLKAKEYSFILASNVLLGNVKRATDEFKSNAQIVLLAGFGDATTDDTLSVLAMPAQSISIANILNGVSDNFSYSANENASIRFTAPDARVLVVDDIGTNLKVAEGLMAPYKMQIDLCLSGVEAIEAAKEVPYDLVFMDHMMPEMDGIEATKIIREFRRDLPIIALTANAVSGVREMFLEHGFNDFLSKPIETVKLNSTLAKWVPKNKQERNSSEDARATDEILAASEIKIEGIDIKKGIKTIGGKFELYMQTLAVFHKDGLQKIGEIKRSLEAGNYLLYATYAHALKSASANIGAIGLSEAAKELEAAGKREDSAFIALNNAKFLASLETLLSDISRVLAGNREARQGSADLELLRSELNRLLMACRNLRKQMELAKAWKKFCKAF